LFKRSAITFAALLCSICVSLVAEESACNPKDEEIIVAFLNGINNTEDEARKSVVYLRDAYGDTAPNTASLKYELLYNESKGALSDLHEVYGQILEAEGPEIHAALKEQYDLLMLLSVKDETWLEKLFDAIPALASFGYQFNKDRLVKFQQSLLGLSQNPPAEIDYAAHRTRIDSWALEGNRILFVAHSQGNLFATAAYKYAVQKLGEDYTDIIHVAPPSDKIMGNYVLADKDRVINWLTPYGAPEYTTIIPDYSDRPPGPNGQTDILGHGFVEIYINAAFTPLRIILEEMDRTLSAMYLPPKRADRGAFTATLIWDGLGDVDLHVTEPNGKHVYFINKKGDSGYLDVDNTVSYGPEHYYATCDANALQTGTYKVGIANYSGATGKGASVQISSDFDGVLATEEVELGEPTGKSVGYRLFNVSVTRDSSGAFKVEVAP
jgi:hypothetical protein